MATHTIVTIVGSLRKESFSLKIANALAKLAPSSLKPEAHLPCGFKKIIRVCMMTYGDNIGWHESPLD